MDSLIIKKNRYLGVIFIYGLNYILKFPIYYEK